MAKFNNDNIGGKEYGPVNFKFDGDIERARHLVGVGRKCLGILKNKMRLGRLSWLEEETRFDDGSVIVCSSNQYGLADIDTVRIYVPPLSGEGAGEKDIMLGFIVRITSNQKIHLVLNVKEPSDVDTGIQTKYWQDTAVTDPDKYADWQSLWEGFEDYPDFKTYGFEKTWDLYATLTTPPNPKDTGYRTSLQGIHSVPVDHPMTWVFPGRYIVTNETTARCPFNWFGQLWSGSAPIEEPVWGGYADAINANQSIEALDGGDMLGYMQLLVSDIEAYYNAQDNVVTRGLAPTSILQRDEDPITRFYNTDYDLTDGTIVVKAIEDNPKFNAFAVVKPGVQQYRVPEQYQSLSRTETTDISPWNFVNPWELDRPLRFFAGNMAWVDAPPGTYLLAFSSIGGSATISTEPWGPYEYPVPEVASYHHTRTFTWEFDMWEMFTNVKGGVYEVDIDVADGWNLSEITDRTFEVDIVPYGSKYPIFKYSDEINASTLKSKKICKIRLGSYAKFDLKGPNPHIEIEARQ